MRPKVILDPHFRILNLVFSSEDLEHLHSFAEVIWERDEPMPLEEISKHREDVVAIAAGHWRHGDIADFPRLGAFLELGGGFPSPDSIDYDTCFARGIRVLSCAPAFGPAVAEMGLAMALASARQLVETDRDLRVGKANWSHTELGDPFLLYDKPVGFIGFGGLARALKPLIGHSPLHLTGDLRAGRANGEQPGISQPGEAGAHPAGRRLCAAEPGSRGGLRRTDGAGTRGALPCGDRRLP
jgi:phosphoglycerate dehydrogenase-like enzyme